MTDAKAMTQAIMQAVIEAAKVVVQAMVVAGTETGAGTKSKAVSLASKLGVHTCNQPTFDCSTSYKYRELRNFRLEVNNIFQTYIMQTAITIIKNG